MKEILITGASQRLGLYLTTYFLKDRWKVWAVTRAPSNELTELISEYSNLELVTVNEYSLESGRQTIGRIIGRGAKLSAVINNASIFVKDRALGKGISFSELFNVHVLFPGSLSQALYESYDECGIGALCLINITDIYVDNPNEDYSYYCASKAGLDSLGKSMAKKYSPKFRVNSIKPGPVKFLDSHSESYKKMVLSQTLLPLEPGFKPILKGVQYLIDNDYVTGSSIYIDGGRSVKR